MKIGLYWKYSTRSLVRGGQRTLLAIFCVAVGVLAIVALQLVGNMVNDALTSNVREGNGGDVSVRNDFAPLQESQLSFFDHLQSQGNISAYAAISEHDGQTIVGGQTKFYILKAFDPAHFPLVGSPTFNQPSNGTFTSLLGGDNVVVTKNLLANLGAHQGDQVQVTSDDGRVLNVTIAGVIEDAGFFRRPQMLMSLAAYSATTSTAGKPVDYGVVYLTVPNASDNRAAAVAKQVQQQFPLATVTTNKEALQQDQSDEQNIRYFLQVVGLLALLIGGVGIINTMQVMLRRRRVEIAMLKTTGYRQRDLYLLFGLEAALLGLMGGIVGAAAGTGISYFIKQLVERAFFIHLNFTVDPVTVGSGVLIGFFTALIFGLLPIVQAGQIRPQAVLRETSEGASWRSVVLSGVLLVLLALLFLALATSILGNLLVATYVVGGTIALIAALSILFGLLVFAISHLPVLERFNWWYALLMVASLAISTAITIYQPAFGVLALALSLFGVLVVLLPRTWKSNVKMALRNLGRARVRTVTTMVALFVGVFAIGLVLVLGQNIKDKINTALTANIKYNSYIIVQSAADKAAVDATLSGLPGLQKHQINPVARVLPLAINGTPIAQVLRDAPSDGGPDGLGRDGALRVLSGIQGYDVGAGQLPSTDVSLATTDTNGARLVGRMLDASDANSSNIIIARSATLAPLHLKAGDQITVLIRSRRGVAGQTGQAASGQAASGQAASGQAASGQAGKVPPAATETLTVVGFWDDTGKASFATIFASNQLVNTVSGDQPIYVYSLQEDPSKADQALQQMQQAVPTVQTFSLVDIVLLVNTLLNNLIIMLIAVASLAMLAGIIIIANAVALAMLERRRELGILKAVGHTSGSVLREVLIENGAVGFVGALLAMLLVTLATTVLAVRLFKTDFGVGAPIVIGLTLTTGVVCMLVASVVAWGATRVRPLEVLRYE